MNVAEQTQRPSETVVRASGVSIHHGGSSEPTVDQVSIEVRTGEIVGVVGESGSGKTTLAMAIAGLGPHVGASVSGELDVVGCDPYTADRARMRQMRADVQVVFQNPHASLDPRQSVRAGFGELRGLQPERTSWTTDEQLMERVRLAPELLDRYPHQLSGGQAQRVCIARALLFRPRLLIADEPTSGLDVSVQASVLQLLLDVRERDGIAMLFISHDLSVVRLLCDRVHVMRGGRVVESGETSRVLSAPEDDYTRKLLAASPGRRSPGGPGVVIAGVDA
ncbi:MAG: dipeptide/oligopeptide/nickel ABC transporter ATP-binding protein [Patulibacter sp.]